MTKAIHISAIIPTYNREMTIARAIDSVLTQEHPAFEIIVIDDGSYDHTRNIVESYGAKVRYIYQDNAGVAAARNRGVNEAKCEWVAFLDSDDFWLPHHLKRMTDAIRDTEGKAALYFSDIQRFDAHGVGSYWDLCGFRVTGSYALTSAPSEWAIMARQPMTTPVSVIQRERYIEIGGMSEALVTSEDTLLFHKLCLHFQVCAVSGYGAVISSDCNRDCRLTGTYNSSTPKYHECSKLLYKELLRYRGKMSSNHLRWVKKGLVDAYLSSARVFLKKKQFFPATANLVGAFCQNPLVWIELVTVMLMDHYSKRPPTR